MEMAGASETAGQPVTATPCACTVLKAIDWANDPATAFHVGLRCALDDWDVLRTAIQDGWAGSDRLGRMYCNDLYIQLSKRFTDGASRFDADDIVDMLAEFMSSKFSCDLEDDSMDWVADLSIQLHQDCELGDFTGLRTLIERNPSPPSLMAIVRGQPLPDTAPKCNCQGPDAGGSRAQQERLPRTAIESDPDEAPILVEAPVLVDDDGWQTVTTKKSRRKRPQ